MNQHNLGRTDVVRKLIIDGRFVMPVEGRTFGTYNPSTGELLATVAEGDARDIDWRSLRHGALSRGHGRNSRRSSARKSS